MEKLNLIDLKPADTPDYMIPAWLGCITFAIRQPGALDQFRADTGFNWEPGKTGIDRMIDEATGREQDFVREFVLWVNRNVWGPVGASDDQEHHDGGGRDNDSMCNRNGGRSRS